MAKTLIIAEKPSVAEDIAKALGGKFKKEKTALEGGDYIVSWALGHLVGIADPKEMGEEYKAWSMNTLPIIPTEFKLTALDGTKAQLAALGKLIRSKDVDTIVNACDAGREGELIFHYIVEFEKGKKGIAGKTIKRLWMQSMTQEAIKDALAHTRTHAEMHKLQDAALSRSEADWLVGINGSRGLTAYNSRHGGFQLTPCGRVQTPTLALMVKREEERLAFEPKPFWTVQALFEAGATYTGKWFTKTTGEDGKAKDETRIWDEAAAEAVKKKCLGKTGTATEETKPVRQACPPLYDLTSLQREANSRFGFSAKTTLQIAQALYERHKLTTYPRTDSKFLPDDYVPTVKQTFAKLTGNVKKYADEALQKGYVVKTGKVFNTAKVSDHHAIIPTGKTPNGLSDAEQKIYQAICQRFVAVFFPPAEYLSTTRITTIENETFKTEGKVLQNAGWKAVYGHDADDESEQDKLIPAIDKDAKPKAKEIAIDADLTKPPARYTESSLLSAMESAGKLVDDEDMREAMKERGLGTPATRAATIEKLISDKYLNRDGKELIPTTKAFELIHIASAMEIENLTSPELTGEWEYKLGLIEKGQFTRTEFMKEIESLTREMVGHIKSFKESDTRSEEAVAVGSDGRSIFETVSSYETSDGIRLRKIIGGRHMSLAEIQELLSKRKIGPFTDFRSKKGKNFSAVLTLTPANKVEFVFEDDDPIPEGQEPMGTWQGQPVFETLTGYATGDKSMRIGKTMLGKEIGLENIQKMLAGQKTALITGFRSARTRKNFDAYLLLDEKGKIKFDFPPRAPRAFKKKAEA